LRRYARRLRLFRSLVPDLPCPGGVCDCISRKAPSGRRWGGIIGNAGVESSEDDDEDDDDDGDDDDDDEDEELEDELELEADDDDDGDDFISTVLAEFPFVDPITGMTPSTLSANPESTSTFLLFSRPDPSSGAEAVIEPEADLFLEVPALNLTLLDQS